MSVRKVYPAKAPGETAKYGFNWSPRNLGVLTITSVTATVLSGSAVVSELGVAPVPNAREGQGTIMVISGGALGELVSILLEVTLSDGQVLQQTVYLPIRDK